MPSPFTLPGRPRAAGRLTRSPQLSAALAARLTARDRWLLRMLWEHRVLTTAQITQLAFGTTRAATARMTVLYEYRAVDRFRPLAPAGSAPLHFILDEAGAMLLAAEDGITPEELGYRRDRSMAIALSPRLAHNTGANAIFTALAAAARASGGHAALECWWGERRCAATWGDHARPDGYGRWSEHLPGQPPGTADFFLEYDTGSEPLTRVIAKLAGYAALAARTGITTPVLFWLPSPARESALHARLAGPPPPGITDAACAAQIPGVPVATATRGTTSDGPARAAWLPAGSPGPRLRLAQLAPPGIAPADISAAGGSAAGTPGGPPGGLAWHPPRPAPPAWHALPGEPRPGQDSDD
jgi:Replication-relaxation